MTANLELGSAFSIRYLIALTPSLNSFEGMEPEASMMKTTSYVPSTGPSKMPREVVSTDCKLTTTPV